MTHKSELEAAAEEYGADNRHLKTSQHFIDGANWALTESSVVKELKKENEELKLQLEFTKQYLNPADTSFRVMMEAFHELSSEQKDKLIDLSRSLANLAEAK
jgi:hypothetical protein